MNGGDSLGGDRLCNLHRVNGGWVVVCMRVGGGSNGEFEGDGAGWWVGG